MERTPYTHRLHDDDFRFTLTSFFPSSSAAVDQIINCTNNMFNHLVLNSFRLSHIQLTVIWWIHSRPKYDSAENAFALNSIHSPPLVSRSLSSSLGVAFCWEINMTWMISFLRVSIYFVWFWHTVAKGLGLSRCMWWENSTRYTTTAPIEKGNAHETKKRWNVSIKVFTISWQPPTHPMLFSPTAYRYTIHTHTRHFTEDRTELPLKCGTKAQYNRLKNVPTNTECWRICELSERRVCVCVDSTRQHLISKYHNVTIVCLLPFTVWLATFGETWTNHL